MREYHSVPSASQVGRNYCVRLAGNCSLSPPPALFLSPEQTDAHGPKTGMGNLKARKEEKATPEEPTLTAPKPLFKHAHSPVTQASRCPPKPPYPNERSRGEPRTEGGAPQLRPTRLRASDCPAAASWGPPWLSTALVPPRVLATCSTGFDDQRSICFLAWLQNAALNSFAIDH